MPAPAFTHCWKADLSAGGAVDLSVLSPTEHARRARFHYDAHRQTYGRAHVFLRQILARYTGIRPEKLLFGTELREKPTLLAPEPLHFNLSYRADCALLALSNRYPVGTDVEPLRPVIDAEALIDQLFSAAEKTALRHSPTVDWTRLFYGIWTRKEAYAKAQGMGLALPFAEFSVLINRADTAEWCQPAGVQLANVPVAADYLGAVGALTTVSAVTWQHYQFPA